MKKEQRFLLIILGLALLQLYFLRSENKERERCKPVVSKDGGWSKIAVGCPLPEGAIVEDPNDWIVK